MHLRRTLLPLLAAALVVGPAAYAATAPSPAAATPAAFSPAVPLFDADGASTLGAEPSIEVDSKGHVYVSAPAGVPTGGCPFWDVHPDALNADGLPYDYRGTIDTDHASVGGGDCDISITPHDGPYDQVSVTSLSLANLTSNTTSDGGKTFRVAANPASQQVFGVDRQWQASDPGLDRHYLSVHDLATTNIQVSVATDGGYQYVQNTPAINPTEAPGATGAGGNHFGTTVVDPTTHKLYIPFLAPGPDEATGGVEHAVWVAEGDPCAVSCEKGLPAGPIVWTDHLVYTAPDDVQLSHIFPAIAIDKAGQLYLAWTGDTTSPATAGDRQSDNRIFFTHSTGSDVSEGAWSEPVAIDPGTAHSNMFPWLIAGDAGQVAAVWYQSQLTSGSTCGSRTGVVGDGNGVNNNCLNDWTVAYAQTSDAGATFTRSTASGVVHNGSVCDSGTTCLTSNGDRTLLDFFDVALDPQGRPNIAFVSDVRAPGTADVQFTRMCSGTSLTGVAVPGPCGPLGTAAPCGDGSTYADAAGDATSVQGNEGVAPNDPALDVLQGRLATGRDGAVTFTAEVADLTPPTAYGQYADFNVTVGGHAYFLGATRAIDGTTSFEIGDFSGTGGTRAAKGTLTGAFDDAADEIRVVLPAGAVTPALGTGDVLSGLSIVTRRQIDAVAISAIPDADTATSTCGYAIGTAAGTASPTTTATATATATASTSPTATSTGTPASDSPAPTSSASPTSGGTVTPTPDTPTVPPTSPPPSSGSVGGTPASASPSPSGSATPTGSPASSGSPAASASASPSASPSRSAVPSTSPTSAATLCSTPTTRAARSTVLAGSSVQVVVSAPAGTPVRLLAYSRPSTTYGVVRTLTTGADGTVATTVRLGGNTRMYAQQVGCTEQGPSTTVTVQRTISLMQQRQSARTYALSGSTLPARAGTLVTVYSGGKLLAQARTDAKGHYRVVHRFTRTGRQDLVSKVGTDANASGGSSRAVRLTVR